MTARTSKGTETRRRIILAAADLFHQQGVRATSPDQIIERSETGKGQFYHYFKSKEGLVHAVLQHYLESIVNGTAAVDYEVSSWSDLERWFLSHVRLQETFGMKRGCPFGTIGNEITENDELIRQDVNLIFEAVKNKLAAFFIGEKARGALSRDADPARMSEFAVAAIQGAMLIGRVKRSSEAAKTVAAEASAHLRRYALIRAERSAGRAGPRRPALPSRQEG